MKIILLFAISMMLLSSCATYHMSTKSLLEQFADTTPETKFTYIIVPPFFVPGVVKGNSLREVMVLDNQEKEVILPVTNHTGVRITKNDGKKTTFYFNTLILQDSTITGKKDHFMGMNIKPITLNSIKKIELQK